MYVVYHDIYMFALKGYCLSSLKSHIYSRHNFEIYSFKIIWSQIGLSHSVLISGISIEKTVERPVKRTTNIAFGKRILSHFLKPYTTKRAIKYTVDIYHSKVTLNCRFPLKILYKIYIHKMFLMCFSFIPDPRDDSVCVLLCAATNLLDKFQHRRLRLYKQVGLSL